MKKARTPLAIWLALILTLTLFPTALAEPTEPSTTPQMATITFDNGDAPDDVTVPSLIEKETGPSTHRRRYSSWHVGRSYFPRLGF